MPSQTSRLQLLRHAIADRFRVSDYTFNWNKIDQFPGVFICTSATRPNSWSNAQEGMSIFETDTGLVWHWNGSSFVRNYPKGHRGYDSTTSEVVNATNTYETAVSTMVTVLAGGRRHRVTVGGPGVKNTNGLTRVGIFRDATLLNEWHHQGGTGGGATERPRPLSFTAYDVPSAGLVTYSLQFSTVSGLEGTSTLEAGANTPIFISVEEV